MHVKLEFNKVQYTNIQQNILIKYYNMYNQKKYVNYISTWKLLPFIPMQCCVLGGLINDITSIPLHDSDIINTNFCCYRNKNMQF